MNTTIDIFATLPIETATRPSLELPPLIYNPYAAPAPGIYAHASAEAYHRWDAISSTKLHHLKKSPKQLRAHLDTPIDTDTFRLGRASHVAILEPELFSEQYVKAEQCHETTGKGARCTRDGTKRRDGLWYCTQHFKDADGPADNIIVLGQETWEKTLNMRDAVYAHPEARDLLDGTLYREVSITWDDAETGLRCKARPDAYVPGILVDLKTTSDPLPDAFSKSIFDYGYYRQQPFYQLGLEHHGHDVHEIQLIAIESKFPFDVVVYRLTQRCLEKGRGEIDQLLPLYRRCLETNDWPGYSANTIDIDIPNWALTR